MGVVACLDASFSPAGASVRASGSLELRGPFFGAPPSYHLRNTTAGILSGDSYTVRASTEPGARVQVRSTAASRVYAMPGAGACLQTELTAAPDSSLVWGPHATILQADADLRQETIVRLQPGGSVVLAELLVMGRLARGERYAFRRYESAIEVTDAFGEPLYAERYRLLPDEHLAASMAGRGVLVSIYVLGTTMPDGLGVIADEYDLAGVSSLPNRCGGVVRALHASLSEGLAFSERCLAAIGAPVETPAVLSHWASVARNLTPAVATPLHHVERG